jgi:hypothetical protein
MPIAMSSAGERVSISSITDGVKSGGSKASEENQEIQRSRRTNSASFSVIAAGAAAVEYVHRSWIGPSRAFGAYMIKQY